MRNEQASNDDGGGCVGSTLQQVWHVDADRRYAVGVDRPCAATLIALRTHAGMGSCMLRSTHLELTAGSLLVVPHADIVGYRCHDQRWHFHWLVLAAPLAVSLPTHRALSIAPAAEERAQLDSCMRLLRRGHRSAGPAASALALALLHRWQLEWETAGAAAAAHRLVDRARAIMHERLDQSPPLYQIAAELGVSERHLRTLFHRGCGMAPKAAQNAIRLDHARHLLALGAFGIADIARQLGYASPFHFSRAFKRSEGCSPSAWAAAHRGVTGPGAA
ncbi:MAG: helix-turn-helix transcriptional regulator [Planctomycetota bacterium]